MHAATRVYCVVLTVCLALVSGSVCAASSVPSATLTQSILHTLDYVAVDYPHTVQGGVITDPEEFAEQREFAERLQAQLRELPEGEQKSVLQQRAAALATAIEQHAPGEQVQALCAELSTAVIRTYQVQVVPMRVPTLHTVSSLFQQQCANCHGREGFGNGPAAAALRPPPSDFHARERQSQRSVYGLYNTITLGVEGTAMPSFAHLSDTDRWALAFYVSNFFATEAQRARGQELWKRGHHRDRFASLAQLTQATPAGVASEGGDDGLAVLTYLRSAPEQLAAKRPSPLAFSSEKLAESLTAYRAGEPRRAYELAIAAYLEGFELAEAGLQTVAPELKRVIETKMGQYRQAVQQHVSVEALTTQVDELQQLLREATERLHTTTLSAAMGFVGAFMILLREGLEAVLVLAAIVAFLVKIQRRDALYYVHIGWIGALVAGLLTWLLATSLIRFDGANRELTEGLTALFAMGMLLYVGLWLHNHSHAQHWQRFIHEKVQHTLTHGTIWSLAVISFVAVYREVVETVLFYETLWLQPAVSHTTIVLGLMGAAGALGILAWAIFRLSTRLPLRAFFRINAVFMLILAVIFAGKGVAALQEAGKLPIDSLHIPTIDVLGVYPTLESFGLQIALLCMTSLWLMYQHRQDNV